MKIALIDCKRQPKYHIDKRLSVNERNLIYLSEILNADFIYNQNVLNTNKTYDIMIFGFNSFSNDFELTEKLIHNNPDAKLYWLVGEYEQSNYWGLHKSKRRFNVIKNFEGFGKITGRERIDNYHTLNINLLIAKQQNELTNKKYDCVYYSRWRPNREIYCKEYLQGNIYFSSDSKNLKKFKHIGCNPKYIGKLNWNNMQETLNNFKYSLYIEDIYTHSNYNHLANRFYESLFCNVVQFFDINCKNTIEKSGIEFDNYFYVKNYNELIAKINETNQNDNWNKAMQFQSQWNIQALQQKEQMINELKTILGI